MSKLKENSMKYSYNDVMIKPAIISTIEHRAECNPFDENGNLPLFTAPMDTVVGLNNYKLFEKNGIIPILPRTESEEDRIMFATSSRWAAFSLQEFEKWFLGNVKLTDKITHIRALIDIANGHIAKLYELVRKSKQIYGNNIEIMVGNIANPETYRACVESQVDFCRVGIGGGNGCLSTSNLGVHHPIASLISEIYDIKQELISRGANKNKLTKIVADGGIRNYSDIIKALALGADYIMVGSVFSRMLESSAIKLMDRGVIGQKKIRLRFPLERYENLKCEDGCWTGDYTDEFMSEMKERDHETEKCGHVIGEIHAKFYGMASKAGQIAMKGKKVHTSEGIEKILPVTYTMSTWVENMIDYLRSAMSYTNSKTLDDLKQAEVILISNNTYHSVNK